MLNVNNLYHILLLNLGEHSAIDQNFEQRSIIENVWKYLLKMNALKNV